MGYKVDYGSMQELLNAYNGAVGNWSAGISSVMQKELVIEESANVSGNKANNLKQYLAAAYSCVNDSLVMLLELFRQNYLLYTEAYHQQIDSARNIRIDSEELSRLRDSLQEKRGLIQQIGINAERTVAKVSDIITLPSLDISEPDAQIGNIITSLDDLDAAINMLESSHTFDDFTEIDELIYKLDAYLLELIGQSKEFKTEFSSAGFFALSSVPGLVSAMQGAYNQLSAQESEVALAVANLEKRLEQERQEMEERKKQADWAKAGANIIVGVVTAAALTTTGPVGAIAVGAISGATSAMFDAAADEYVEKGWNMGDWDVDRIKIRGCIGTVTGMVGSLVPSSAGLCTKAGIDALSSAFENAANSSYEQFITYGSIVDARTILVDAAEKGAANFAGSMVGGAIADNIKTTGITSLDLAKNDPLNKMHGLSVFVFEGGKSMGTGVISRGVSNLTGQVITNSIDGTFVKINEIDLASVSSDMFSAESMGKDFVGSGLSGMVGDYVELRTPDQDSGLTPIIQYKLGHTPDLETGTAPVVDEALKALEKKEQWEKTHLTDWHSTDWENTSSTPKEILQMEEMEQRGEFVIDGEDYSPVKATSDFEESRYPAMRTPKGNTGMWLGDPGNSEFVPNDLEAQKVMREYGQESVSIHSSHPDFSPFSIHETPWGSQICEVEVGHMTSQRTGTDGNYFQADEELARKIGKGVTSDDVRHYREQNKLTWHEVEDGKTMQLIPTVINSSVAHTGGVSVSGYVQKMGDISHVYE